MFSDGMVSGSPGWLRTPATLNVQSIGVRPHSIWNQISTGFLVAMPVRWALSVAGKFMGWPAPS
jgi:hypothetical protein